MASIFRLRHGGDEREFVGIDLRLSSADRREFARLAAEGSFFELASPGDVPGRYATMISQAAIRHFRITAPVFLDGPDDPRLEELMTELAHVAAFVDREGRLRVAHRDISIGFPAGTREDDRAGILEQFRLRRVEARSYRRNRWIARDPSRTHTGEKLFDLANALVDVDGVSFATPRFVSEYRREALPTSYASAQWYFEHIGLDAAWALTQGKASVVVASLDDGVEISHPSFFGQISKHPDPATPADLYGRDFFVNPGDSGHFDPRPKAFESPYHVSSQNDIHGTACAGLVCANGAKAGIIGAAPGCKLLPVKIFEGSSMADDARIADAIEYASDFADVLSCSWTGAWDADVESALEEAGTKRGGKGVPVFCAAGNYGSSNGQTEVKYPAAYPTTIAVGACSHLSKHAWYSNEGPEVDLVAPSSGDSQGAFTTDIALMEIAGTQMGYNPGVGYLGGADGALYSDFGGTSAATPIAAAVGALCLSANGALTRDQLRQILIDTADKIDTGYDAQGHSDKLGYGRVNAGKAVAEALKTALTPVGAWPAIIRGLKLNLARGRSKMAALFRIRQSTDQYIERLVKLIPAEVVGAYMVGKSIAPTEAYPEWALVCLILTFVLRALMSLESGRNSLRQRVQWGAVIVATLSFLIWVSVLGDGIGWGERVLSVEVWQAQLAMLIWTPLVPYFVRGDP